MFEILEHLPFKETKSVTMHFSKNFIFFLNHLLKQN